MAQRLVCRNRRLPPRVLFPQIVAVVRAHDDSRVVPQLVAIDRLDQASEPGVDHGELGPVGRSYLVRLPWREHVLADRRVDVWRPDQVWPLPGVVIHGRVWFRRIERLMRVELIDEEQEAVVVPGVLIEPAGGRRHRPWAREVGLFAEVPPRVVIRHVAPSEHRRADPARVGSRPPGIALMSPNVFPPGEVAVIVLASGLEQVRMVGDEHRNHTGIAQMPNERVFPDLDRTPGLPEEVQRPAQYVVPGGYAGQRSGIVLLEAQRAGGEPIKVRGLELFPAVGPHHMAVQAVQQNYDCILRRVRLCRLALCRLGHWPHSSSRGARLSRALPDGIQDRAAERAIRYPVLG